jgi:hypothetical protein
MFSFARGLKLSHDDPHIYISLRKLKTDEETEDDQAASRNGNGEVAAQPDSAPAESKLEEKKIVSPLL